MATKEPQKFACTTCGKRFTRQHGLVRHQVLHTGIRPYVCSICQRSFSYQVTLTEHMRIHTGEKPFSCHCGKRFAARTSLRRHLATHSQQPQATHKCHFKDCGKVYSRSDTLQTHIRSFHSDAKPFVLFLCGICAQTFSSKRNLNMHTETQHGNNDAPKPFKCPMESCGAKFYYQSVLSQHLRAHNGEKPFVCLVSKCGARFCSRQMLKQHHVTHRRLASRFVCPNGCGLRFNRKGNLTRHLKICYGEEPSESEEISMVDWENQVAAV